MQCSFGVPVKKDIADSLAAGQTGDQILARYVAQYGEKILSSPTHRGFNLLAWYGPYAALLVSAAVLVLMLRRWQGSRGAPAAETDSAISDSERDRLKRELDELGR
jgi:cytochrome c-type biogenesis protein CcmH/NrfF